MFKRIAFDVLCWVIITISSIDMYWLSKNKDGIVESEKNPIGRYLIELDDGDVSLFIFWKFMGTFAVIYFLQKFFIKRNGLALIVVGGVAAIQTLLLLYLYSLPPFF